MARMLLTWELGGNFGHLTRLLPLARELRAAGHEVTFAVRATKVAGQLLTPESFAYVQAPLCLDRVTLHRPPASYAELLLAEGYASGSSLLGRVNAWLALYRLVRPDLIFVDHSPTALVAARAAQIPAIPVGNGFEIPPNVTPLPSIRPWEPVSAEELLHSETRVTRSINDCLKTLGSARLLTHLAALFDTPARVLATFSELDHYLPHERATYDGCLFTDSGTASIEWRTEALPRVLTYVHNGLSGLKSLITALQGIEADVVCIVPELSAAAAHRYSSKSLRVLSKPVQLSSALARADLVVCQAGLATMAQSLLAGVPLIAVPGTVEQYMVARRVHELGAGELIGQDRSPGAFTTAINNVLRSDTYRAAARRFARKYSDYDTRTVVRRAVATAEGILCPRLH